MRTDTPYDINVMFDLDAEEYGSYTYKAVSFHRNGTSRKSQWKISVDEEVNFFVTAIEKKHIHKDRGWEISIKNGIKKSIGRTVKGEDSYIGVFECSTKLEWHGYPGDYKRSDKDIPPTTILQEWVNNKYITKSHMSHIQLQMPCNL